MPKYGPARSRPTREAPEVRGKTISAVFAGGGLSWSWELSETELKLVSEPIAQPLGAQEYRFPVQYTGDFAPFAIDDGELFSGDLLFGAPVLLGADCETYHGFAAWQPSKDPSELVLSVDDSKLAKEAFPYRIDPPIVELAAQADHFTAAPFGGFPAPPQRCEVVLFTSRERQRVRQRLGSGDAQLILVLSQDAIRSRVRARTNQTAPFMATFPFA